MSTTATQRLAQTPEERTANLALGNHVRRHNARVRAEIMAMDYEKGLVRVARLLEDADTTGPIGSLPIGRLLTSVKHMRHVRAEVLMREAKVFRMDRPLRRLTTTQREDLAFLLRDRAARTRATKAEPARQARRPR